LNFTIALLAGLVLLLPGITALVSWNLQGATHGAKRPELQLSSVTALFVALGIAIVMRRPLRSCLELWERRAALGERGE